MEENYCSIVPYHDPTTDDLYTTEQILMFGDENPCLGFAKYPEIPEPSSAPNNAILHNQTNGGGVDDINNILDPDDPLSDAFIWGMINGDDDLSDGNVAAVGGGENYEAGSSGNNGESTMIEQGNNLRNFDSEMPPSGSGFGNPIQLSVWPFPPTPYNCSCCHILREIIHTNGKHVSNLEIHGRLGIISHGVLDIYEMDLSTGNHEYQMFDFCKESIDSVKNFLVQYCQDRKQAGYTLIQDPLSVFYEALCVGFNERENRDDVFPPPSSTFSGFSQKGIGKMSQQDTASFQNVENNGSSRQEILSKHKGEESSSRGPSKSSLASQRERTGKLKLKDFSEFFHLPINDAAKRMKVCPTVIKKKCRQGGLTRWPYRKIKGIKRKISMKKDSLTAATTEERACILEELQTLEQELENIFAELSRC
ncbi:hypothetical protein ACH5RR_039933 [Cinchona calisaya]|uniref:RWP-RK domain-containing protein n=1 Tax=Cinchona calisaya TaxID=153742 RepID=A0ABD2Y280_9GENT